MRLPPSLLQRLRLLFLAAGLASLLAAVLVVAVASEASVAARIAGIVAALGLAAHWTIGFRRRRFGALAELAEPVAMFAILVASPGEPFAPLFAVLFRSLYGSPLVNGLRVVGYVGALLAADVLSGGNVGEDAGRAVGIAIGVGIMLALQLALDRLERSERRLRAMVQQSSDIVAIVDCDLRIGWVADSVGRVLGHDADALAGTPFLDLVHVTDSAAVERMFAEARDGMTVTARMRDADGAFHEIETIVGDCRHDPEIAGYLLNMRDATERRRLEQERQALTAQRIETERLHERVEAQRQRQELEAQLQRSQRLRSVGQLAGGVAHDFNNLLAVILNFAGFVRDELPEASPLRSDVREIEEAARRGARLVRQLLLFSQRKATTPQVLDLNGTIGALDRLLNRSLGEQIELRHRLAPNLRRVEADVGNVEQVLVNLIVNARDALPDGGTVTVTTENVALEPAAAIDLELPPGEYVRLGITDDGCGMDQATAARALEPFFTTKAPGEGTGLGLSSVFGIVSQAGGGVALESSPGAGTTVDVYLPATAKALAGAGGGWVTDVDRATGESVLVVEDEPGVLLLLERILERAGYRPVVASSGEAALDALAGTTVDLVLTDMVMPGISGPELAERIHERWPELPVAFMSGYSEDALERLGSGPVLAKPFDSAGVLRHIRTALDESVGSRALARD